jgi:hypothetical protein
MALNSQQSRVEHATAGNSPSVYVVIEEVTSIGGPSGTANLIDSTHLLSTGKEFLQGLADFGEVTLAGNFTGGTKQMELFDLFSNTADPQEFRIRIPSAAGATTYHTFYFNGVVSGWALSGGVDDKWNLNITIRTSGGMDYAGVIA